MATTNGAAGPPAFPGFEGFDEPGFTQVPDLIFDQLLHLLSGAQLKVLLYIVRKTYGFRKPSDSISLSQLMHGITRRDGTVQDHGTGLTKKTLLEALNWLEEQGYILRQRQDSPERGNEPTAYRLRMRGEGASREKSTPPLGEKLHQGVGGKITPSPWGKNSPTQETLEQETNTSNIASAQPPASAGDTSKFRKGSRPTLRERFSASEGEETNSEPGTYQVSPPLRAHPTPTKTPDIAAATADAAAALPDRVTEHGWTKLSDELQRLGIVPNGRTRGVRSPADQPVQLASPPPTPARAAAVPDQPIPQGRGGPRPQQLVPKAEQQALRTELLGFAEEFHDQAKQSSSLTRLLRYYLDSGLALSIFISRLYAARSRVRDDQRAGRIRKKGSPMAYWLALVEEECGLREAPQDLRAQLAARAAPASSTSSSPARRKSLAGKYAHLVHH